MHVKQFVWWIVCHSNFFGHAEKVSKKLKFNATKVLESKEYSLNVIQNLEEDAVGSYTLIFFTAVLISGVCF